VQSVSLYNAYRPQSFSELKGNYGFIKDLLAKPDHPHAFLFVGPSGTGKTTLSRILAKEVGANELDIQEFNSSDCNGVDDIRSIISSIQVMPFGHASVYILDEFAKVSDGGQNALLKPLEEPPEHAYFILCTTDPAKILKTIKTRCTIVEFKPLTEDDLYDILKDVKKKEGLNVSRDILYALASAAGGSARKALVDLERIAVLPEGEQLAAINDETIDNPQVIDLCRALFSRPNWLDLNGILRILKEKKEDPEKIRRAILGYGQAILLNKFDDIVLHIMTLFKEPVYDTGFPGLIIMCAQSCDLGRF
jgi:DNA polymerase-3 subunit gamma/tau